MSNLLHVLAIDSAIDGAELANVDEVLGSDYCKWVVDTFENERGFYDVVSFLKNYFSKDLFDVVLSSGERQHPLPSALELLRQDGWYLTVLSREQYDDFKAAIIRALADRPWIEQRAPALPRDDRSLFQRLRGVPVDVPKPTSFSHDEWPWTQFADSEVHGDFYVITSTE